MNINTTITLIYAIMALVVAIISATIIRTKMDNWERFNIMDAVISMIFGAVWPITIVVGIVCLASDFLYDKFFKKYGP